jgi:predicted GNAT superfamily acetyltransferase
MIRDFRSTDVASIWKINQANVPAVGCETLEALSDIAALCSHALVAEIESEVAGFCLVLPPGVAYDSPNYRYFSERYDDFIYLDRVAIVEGHRGRGIGAELYREVERRTSALLFTLEVNVVPPNDASMRFHARQGFVEVEQRETRPGKIVSLMVKNLSRAGEYRNST